MHKRTPKIKKIQISPSGSELALLVVFNHGLESAVLLRPSIHCSKKRKKGCCTSRLRTPSPKKGFKSCKSACPGRQDLRSDF
jgi:hypothetical protein